MSMELDRICTVDISLATPISDNASFDNILILGPAPAKPKGSIEAVAAYSGLDELTALGVVAAGENADPVGVAARVAFSQSPKPHDIYVAFLSESDSGGNITPALTTISSIMEHALAVSGWYCVCPVVWMMQRSKRSSSGQKPRTSSAATLTMILRIPSLKRGCICAAFRSSRRKPLTSLTMTFLRRINTAQLLRLP